MEPEYTRVIFEAIRRIIFFLYGTIPSCFHTFFLSCLPQWLVVAFRLHVNSVKKSEKNLLAAAALEGEGPGPAPIVGVVGQQSIRLLLRMIHSPDSYIIILHLV